MLIWIDILRVQVLEAISVEMLPQLFPLIKMPMQQRRWPNSLNGDNQFIELELSSKQIKQNGLQSIFFKFNAPPSIVVNAAGILRDNFILKLDEEQFDDVIRVNLKVKNGINLSQ